MAEIQFKAKPNCKTCYGRGFLTRTLPIPTGRKKMVSQKTLCHCATEITPEKRESIVSDEEVVVPKVKTTKKTYATMTRPGESGFHE
jgi:hypothetical protein